MAAAISNFSPLHNHTPNPKFSTSTWTSRFLLQCQRCSETTTCKKLSISSRTPRTPSHSPNFCSNPRASSSSSSSSLPSSEFDIVVIGAGIIGLTIARQFLKQSDLSVAVIDSSVPCASGATGAGQGYIWMAGKKPDTELWELGIHGKKLWEDLAINIQQQGMNPLQELGWKKTGSLLIAKTSQELDILKDRVESFRKSGLTAELLSRKELSLKEPLVDVGEGGGAAFLPDDCQIDALRAVEFIQKENRGFGSRYAEFFNNPVVDVLTSRNEVEGVKTKENILYCKKALVVAAGSWSGSLMKNISEKFDIGFEVPVKPRKGHLLVIENFNLVKLNHGLMEVGYMDHQIASPKDSSGEVDYSHTMSISMTATLDAVGNLVLGSSRQFAGFDTEIDESIVERIWKRAAEFLPVLRGVEVNDLVKNRRVRVGLRPYMPDGKPIISPVPGVPKVVVAAGHEGVGLTLALGTAEMVFDMVFEKQGRIDSSPFSFDAR